MTPEQEIGQATDELWWMLFRCVDAVRGEPKEGRITPEDCKALPAQITALRSSLTGARANLVMQKNSESGMVKLCAELVAILQNYVGEAGASEGAVDVLKRKLAELAEAKGERDKLSSELITARIGFRESESQLATLRESREKAERIAFVCGWFASFEYHIDKNGITMDEAFAAFLKREGK